MTPELESVLDDIILAGGRLALLAAAVDRQTLVGLLALSKAATGTEWRDRLITAVMKGVNDGK